MKTIQTITLIFLAALLLVVDSPVQAQSYVSPRSVSFSNSFATQSRGSDVIGWNPANLGYADNPRFSMSFGLFPLVPVPALQLRNNAISASWLNQYMLSGIFLDEQDKRDLLSAFPSTGWSLEPMVQARILGLSFGRTAVSLDGNLSGAVVMPKPLLKFVFQGNKFNEPISLSDLNGEFQSVTALSIAHGREVSIPMLEDYVNRTYVGGGIKLLGGIGYMSTDYVDGAITFAPDSLSIKGEATAKSSLMGYGMAFDVGIAAEINDRMTASAGLNNVAGFVSWTDDYSTVYNYKFDFNTDTVDLANADTDSLLDKALKQDSRTDTTGFTTPYPAYFVTGFQYDLYSNLKMFVNYRQGFSNRFNSSTTPMISVASEYRPVGWFPLRFGVSIGGKTGFRWGTGLAFEFDHYRFVLGFSQTGGFFNNADGVSFSLGQELAF
ncbi:MAG: DUF5723 family protein [Candidatus Marinimicrobia bacterium]|nr:DUF5723 family protein [Candidatus Neomarinimicrobiota bacterium]MCF7879232.1 DUF5723 family protein [Candidatus Neomarinimicrobiota bacterium]